jgi:hypothetical protein
VDPLTLFALANGAVAAVKKGCQLYKDIKGAAGEVKSVLKDLDDQFHKAHPPGTPVSIEVKNQFIQEKNRVIELNKRGGETTGIYTELGNYLGDFFDAMTKCVAVIEEEERKNREELYSGDSSLGKRALQLVLMKKQLEAMQVELREMMIYNAPPELGALWTDVSDMMKSMGSEQKILLKKKLRDEEREIQRRRDKFKLYMTELSYGGLAFALVITLIILMAWVNHDRHQRWPELEPAVLAQKREERKRLKLIELEEWQTKQKAEDEYYIRHQKDFVNSQRAKESNEDLKNEDKETE